jgi:hypothetical protein
MAFSRKWLESLGLTEVQVSAIIEEHTAVTDALKEQRDAAKKEADKLPAIQQELDDLKNGEDFKAKYEKEHQDFEDFKAGIAEKEEADKIRTAYRKLLTDERVKEDRLDMVMRHTDFSNMKLDKDGNLENADALKKTIAEDWGVFQVTTHERKQSVATPPGTAGSASGANPGSGTSRARELYLERMKKQGVKVDDTGKE